MPRMRSRGFSLAELLVTLCLLAVLASLAAPSLNQLVQRNRQDTLRQSLTSHLRATRSDAIARARRIELCGSSSGQDCDSAWEKGWLIRDPATNTRLRYSALNSPENLTWVGASLASQSITYQANGTTVSNNGRFILCSADKRVVWQLVINRQGRVRHSDGLESGQSDGVLCR